MPTVVTSGLLCTDVMYKQLVTGFTNRQPLGQRPAFLHCMLAKLWRSVL